MIRTFDGRVMESRVNSGVSRLSGLRWLAGSGRSGTTWVQDALADSNGMRPVFEPLHPRVSRIGRRYGHRALMPGECHPELEQFLEEVSAGRQERLWTQYRCQAGFLLPAFNEAFSYSGLAALAHRWRKFFRDLPSLSKSARRQEPLVKCIWSNLMLGWLSRNCGMRVVLLLRHPGAVIESELRNAWDARPVLQQFRADRKLQDVTDGRYLRFLERRLTRTEGLAVKWLIENQYALESAEQQAVTVVHYELLRASDGREWRKLQVAFGLPQLPDAATLVLPSQQSAPRNSDSTATYGAKRPRWQETLTREQVDELQGVLDDAEFDGYAMAQPFPIRRDSVRQESGL